MKHVQDHNTTAHSHFFLPSPMLSALPSSCPLSPQLPSFSLLPPPCPCLPPLHCSLSLPLPLGPPWVPFLPHPRHLNPLDPPQTSPLPCPCHLTPLDPTSPSSMLSQ